MSTNYDAAPEEGVIFLDVVEGIEAHPMTPSTPDLRDKFAAHVRTGAPCPVPGGVQLCGPHPAPSLAPVAPVVEYPIDFGPGSIHAEALARELAPVDDALASALAERDAAVERVRAQRDECLGSIDAFLGEASPWIEQDGSMFNSDLCEIAGRRLRYTFDAMQSPLTQGGAKP